MPTLTNNIADSIGQFYLGQDVYPERTQGQATLYDAADLTTHAVIIGMTGSGKTGLGITSPQSMCFWHSYLKMPGVTTKL